MIVLEVVAGDLAKAVKEHECAAWICVGPKGEPMCAICEAEVDESGLTP